MSDYYDRAPVTHIDGTPIFQTSRVDAQSRLGRAPQPSRGTGGTLVMGDGREWKCQREGCNNGGIQHAPGTLKKWCSERCRKAQYDLVCVDCGGRVSGTDPGKMSNVEEPVCRSCAGRHYARWDRDAIIAAIQEWADQNGGIPPAATDWNTSMARAIGHPEKAEKFLADGCWPTATSVQDYFESWNAAIKAAGFEPRASGCYGRDGELDEVIQSTAARYLAGMTSPQIAAEDGVSATAVQYRLKKAGVQMRAPGKPHPEHTRRRAVQMYAEGLTSHEVAAQIGVCHASVLSWCRAAGVPVRSRGPLVIASEGGQE